MNGAPGLSLGLSLGSTLAPTLALALEILLLCVAVLLPTVLALRGTLRTRDRRTPALALHRAQRDALSRDQADGLLDSSEHLGARLEIDRRLLAAADAAEDPVRPAPPAGAFRLLLLLLPIPLLAGALYAIGGHPTLPAQPLANRVAEADSKQREDDQLVASLREGLARLDPTAPETRQGYLLLGQAEASRGRWAEAAAAWRQALLAGFDPAIAMQAAEAQSRADGGVSAQSAALFRQALDAAPKDAPWRQLAEQRIAQSEHQADQH